MYPVAQIEDDLHEEDEQEDFEDLRSTSEAQRRAAAVAQGHALTCTEHEPTAEVHEKEWHRNPCLLSRRQRASSG